MIDMMQVEYNNRALLEAKTLINCGFDVVLIGFTYNKKYLGKTKVNGVDCIAYELYNGRIGFQKIIRYFSALWVLVRICIRTILYKADFYHAHNYHVLIPACVSSILRKKQLIYDSHEIWTHHQNYRYALEHIFAFISEKLCSFRIQLLIGTNDLMTNFIKSKYSIRKAFSIYNTPSLIKESFNQKLFHKYYSFSGKDKIVLFQGGLWPTGRPIFEIIDAAEYLPEFIKIIFLGYTSEFHILIMKNYITSKKLNQKVFIHPPQTGDDLLRYTRSADIGLNFISGKNLHQQYQCTWKLFEYCMAGIPVISSDYSFNKWVHSKYDIGPIIDSNNSEEITDTIISVLKDEVKYNRYCKNSLLASREFNWENQATKLYENYNKLSLKSL